MGVLLFGSSWGLGYSLAQTNTDYLGELGATAASDWLSGRLSLEHWGDSRTYPIGLGALKSLELRGFHCSDPSGDLEDPTSKAPNWLQNASQHKVLRGIGAWIGQRPLRNSKMRVNLRIPIILYPNLAAREDLESRTPTSGCEDSYLDDRETW